MVKTIGCLIAPYGFYDSPQKPSFFKIAPEIRPKCSAEAQVLDYMSTCFQMSQKGWALFYCFTWQFSAMFFTLKSHQITFTTLSCLLGLLLCDRRIACFPFIYELRHRGSHQT
jgi:hypothetical protein